MSSSTFLARSTSSPPSSHGLKFRPNCLSRLHAAAVTMERMNCLGPADALHILVRFQDRLRPCFSPPLLPFPLSRHTLANPPLPYPPDLRTESHDVPTIVVHDLLTALNPQTTPTRTSLRPPPSLSFDDTSAIWILSATSGAQRRRKRKHHDAQGLFPLLCDCVRRWGSRMLSAVSFASPLATFVAVVVAGTESPNVGDSATPPPTIAPPSPPPTCVHSIARAHRHGTNGAGCGYGAGCVDDGGVDSPILVEEDHDAHFVWAVILHLLPFPPVTSPTHTPRHRAARRARGRPPPLPPPRPPAPPSSSSSSPTPPAAPPPSSSAPSRSTTTSSLPSTRHLLVHLDDADIPRYPHDVAAHLDARVGRSRRWIVKPLIGEEGDSYVGDLRERIHTRFLRPFPICFNPYFDLHLHFCPTCSRLRTPGLKQR
ncbi:hypothetical protein R3P38DRAFT_3283283 [Favolaschia claudopus]|uniref:Uncharacterized protein n=1 Tax=Favolaschia claudopus TaxID=2862362 RepID=A0AAW0A8S6_9AGAR